ncbi:hypothetical protein Bbelb_054770 [Branchiostoma belcheri]|nr:hypothetical protein Bbelb_054770 [Branchiostoma belcheri]
MKACSTTHCLVDLLNYFYAGAENKSTVSTLILTDFSKAFDRVCHKTAITKLINLGARPSLIPWVCSFVSNRRQCVRYQGVLSQWENLTCGIAQGTLMGPLLFLTLINDTRPVSENSYWKYVDDYNLGEIRRITTPTSLQSDLNNLDTWAAENNMLLNPKKCKAMHFSFVRTPLQPPVLTLAGQTLDTTSKTRLLGLHIRSDLKWDDQVEDMVSKSSKRLVVISRLRRSGVPVADLNTIYCGYIRPLLEYAAPCWASALTHKQSAALERVQRRACRMMMGRQFTTYTEALQHLGLQRLSARRQKLCTDFALKVERSPRFSAWLPPTRGQLHGRHLRNSTRYQQPTGTKRYINSAIPAMTKLLNGL